MKKKIIFLLLLLFFLSLTTVSAGNNTTTIEHPTDYYSINNNTVTALEEGDSNISFSDGYKGYCIEWGEHSAEKGDIFYVESTNVIKNSKYLKAMFLFFYPQTQKDVIATQHMIWKFTDDKQFSRFNQTWYEQIYEAGDKCTIPDNFIMKINDTHEFGFSFKVFVAEINEYQNYFGYKFFIREIQPDTIININNSTINNSTTLLPNTQNNDMTNQYYNNITISNKNNINTYTSNLLKTGNNIYIIFVIILILIYILVSNIKFKR